MWFSPQILSPGFVSSPRHVPKSGRAPSLGVPDDPPFWNFGRIVGKPHLVVENSLRLPAGSAARAPRRATPEPIGPELLGQGPQQHHESARSGPHLLLISFVAHNRLPKCMH
jgi:hypothetical protein